MTWNELSMAAQRTYNRIFSARMFGHAENLEDEYADVVSARLVDRDNPDANVVTSKIDNESLTHLPVFDIDYPAYILGSSTEGHYHLYLNKPLSWRQYARLLKVMGEVGLIEKGFADLSIERGHGTLRLPWVKKETT